MTKLDSKYGYQGSFEVKDPDVDLAKVQDYVDWKKSTLRYPIHEWARERHWGYWNAYRPVYVQGNLLLDVYHRVLKKILALT